MVSYFDRIKLTRVIGDCDLTELNAVDNQVKVAIEKLKCYIQ